VKTSVNCSSLVDAGFKKRVLSSVDEEGSPLTGSDKPISVTCVDKVCFSWKGASVREWMCYSLCGRTHTGSETTTLESACVNACARMGKCGQKYKSNNCFNGALTST
jgi:hypothetical protein